jgi:hypothetical protein
MTLIVTVARPLDEVRADNPGGHVWPDDDFPIESATGPGIAQ